MDLAQIDTPSHLFEVPQIDLPGAEWSVFRGL